MGNASNKLPAVSILSCHQDGSLEAFQDDVTNVYKCLGRNKRSMECSNNSATPWPKPRSHAQCAAMAAGTADHKHKPRKIVSSVCGRRYRCYRLLQVFIASKEVADSKVSRRGSKSWDKKTPLAAPSQHGTNGQTCPIWASGNPYFSNPLIWGLARKSKDPGPKPQIGGSPWCFTNKPDMFFLPFWGSFPR